MKKVFSLLLLLALALVPLQGFLSVSAKEEVTYFTMTGAGGSGTQIDCMVSNVIRKIGGGTFYGTYGQSTIGANTPWGYGIVWNANIYESSTLVAHVRGGSVSWFSPSP